MNYTLYHQSVEQFGSSSGQKFFVGPDLGPSCLQRLSADNTKRSYFNFTGVGKTSLVHLICHNEPTSNPNWTIGCSVEVKVVFYYSLLDTGIIYIYKQVYQFRKESCAENTHHLILRKVPLNHEHGPGLTPAAFLTAKNDIFECKNTHTDQHYADQNLEDSFWRSESLKPICWLVGLMPNFPVNSYDHVRTVSSPNHRVFLCMLDKTVSLCTSCTYFRL